MPKQPNILFAFTDQQRWDTIHAAGNPHIRTPVMDRLCHEGVNFTRGIHALARLCISPCIPYYRTISAQKWVL